MNTEEHCNLIIPITLEDMRSLWANLDDEYRMEIIKSVIWTACDMHEFHEKVCKEIACEKFKDTLD